MAYYKKYHIIVADPYRGEDDKQDCDTLKEAAALAREYLEMGWDRVKVFCDHKVVREYIKFNGRLRRLI